MDPVSLITLVQTVVQIVKLANAVKEAFSKASQNDSEDSARVLINELLEAVASIESCNKKRRLQLDGPTTKLLLDIPLLLRDTLAKVLLECEKLRPQEQPTDSIAGGKAPARPWIDGDDVKARIEGLRALAKEAQVKLMASVGPLPTRARL